MVLTYRTDEIKMCFLLLLLLKTPYGVPPPHPLGAALVDPLELALVDPLELALVDV